MGLFRKKRPVTTAVLDLGAVQVDWPAHLSRVRQLAQLQASSSEGPSRAEPSRPLLLHLIELPVAEQASLVLHQHLLASALWRRDVAAVLPRTPFRAYDQPWGLGVLGLLLPLVLRDGEELVEAALSGRSELLVSALHALTAGEVDGLLSFAAVVYAVAAVGEDPATDLVGLAEAPVTGMDTAFARRDLWPGAPEDWGQGSGPVDVERVPLHLDQEHPSQSKVADKVASGVRRTFTLSSEVPAQFVGPRVGANLVGGNLFVGALSGLLDSYLQVLGLWCLHGVEPVPLADDAPALSEAPPVPLTADPGLDVAVRLDVRLRGRLPRPDEPVGAPDSVRATLEGEGSAWVVELPLPHGETGPLDPLVTAHLRLLAEALLGLPGLSGQARQVLSDVAALRGRAGELAATDPTSSAAALAQEWLAQGLARP